MKIITLIGLLNVAYGVFLYINAAKLSAPVPEYLNPSYATFKLFGVSYVLTGIVALFGRLWNLSDFRVRSLLCYFHFPLPLLTAYLALSEDWHAFSCLLFGGPSILWWMPLLLDSDEPEVEAETEAEIKTELLRRSREKTLVVVFLRHFGCVFCKELLQSLLDYKKSIESSGSELILVHLLGEEDGAEYLKELGFEGVRSISDPQCKLYRSFGVRRASWTELVSPIVLGRFLFLLLRGYKPGRIRGDAMQLSGVVVLSNGKVARKYMQRRSSDKTDLSICTLPGS